MYGKIFDSIFKSTLVSEGGWLPTYIFMSMITLADKDGIINFAAKSLYTSLGFRSYDSKITYEDFKQALDYLEQEDPESNSDAENGRRIVPLSEVDSFNGNRGWLIVNYLEYRKKASSMEPPGSSTERVRRWRERQKKHSETKCNGDETNGNGHTDTDTDNNPPISPRGGNRAVLKSYQYPDWLNRELWADFHRMRSRIKKPITTDRTITGLMNALQKLIDKGYDQSNIIQLAIDQCWRSFYPPKDGSGKVVKPSTPKPFTPTYGDE